MIKYLLATLALIAAAAGATWLVSYRLGTGTAIHAAVQKRDALEWLRNDFDLNDADSRSNSLRKINLIAEVVNAVRDAIEFEVESLNTRPHVQDQTQAAVA